MRKRQRKKNETPRKMSAKDRAYFKQLCFKLNTMGAMAKEVGKIYGFNHKTVEEL